MLKYQRMIVSGIGLFICLLLSTSTCEAQFMPVGLQQYRGIEYSSGSAVVSPVRVFAEFRSRSGENLVSWTVVSEDSWSAATAYGNFTVRGSLLWFVSYGDIYVISDLEGRPRYSATLSYLNVFGTTLMSGQHVLGNEIKNIIVFR